MATPRTPGQETVLRFLGGTADDYDRVVAESTGGWDRRWKQELLGRMDDPRQVLDLASGTGILTFMVLERFPPCHVTGVDLQEDYQAVAIARARQRGVDGRATWHRSAVEDVELPAGAFDHIVTCYLPKYADRPVLAERLARWCAPGGRVLLHDFAHPEDPRVEAVLKQQYERWMARVELDHPHWIPCFEGLYDIVRESPWTEDLPPLLEAAGFVDVELERWSYGCAALLSARKPA